MSRPLESSPAWRLLFAAVSYHSPKSDTTLPMMASADWEALYGLCRRHGLFPLVNRGLQTIPPGVLPGPYRERFRNAAAAVTLRSLQLQQEMQRLIALLAAAGIPVIPFKGPVLAEQAYGDVALRDFIDIDFLVPKAQVATAVSLLAEHGYQISAGISDRDWQKLLATTNEVNLRHATQSWVVEVHWDFVKPWLCLHYPFDRLWEGIDPGSVQSRLDEVVTLLHLCIHGTNHYWDKFKWVVDVDRFVRTRSDLDWSQLFTLAGEAGCTRAVLLGLSLANRWMGLPLPEPVMNKLGNDGRLPQLRSFVESGWQHPADSKKSLPGRVFFILLCRESLAACWQSIRQAILARYVWRIS